MSWNNAYSYLKQQLGRELIKVACNINNHEKNKIRCILLWSGFVYRSRKEMKMENEEKRNSENEFTENCCDTSRLGGRGMPEMMAKCCEGMRQSNDSRSMMSGCMKMCRWFPLLPVVLGILFLLLGYYLDAEVTRILWMVAAGFLVLMGTFCLLMMCKMLKICRGTK